MRSYYKTKKIVEPLFKSLKHSEVILKKHKNGLFQKIQKPPLCLTSKAIELSTTRVSDIYTCEIQPHLIKYNQKTK